MIEELATWGMRLFRLLPEIMGLWEAAKTPDTKAKLDAQLALTRAMERQQALEEMGGGP